MTRIVYDRGHQIFYDHGDGLAGASMNIGGVENTLDAAGVGRVTVWKAPSGDGTTNVDGTFAVGDTVKTQFDHSPPIGNKVHDMTYRGTYTYTDSNGDSHVFLVLHGTSSYGGAFALIGPSLPSRAIYDAMIADFNSESDITAESFVVCFFPGTLIATPSGERRVEDLRIGDPVLVQDAEFVPGTCIGRMMRKFRRKFGLGRSAPVKWLGRQTVSTRFGPADRLMPVRFAAGSLGGGGGEPLLPHSDLTVTADHAMLLDGVLCEAGSLVNGTTITHVPLSELGESYTVYHVETEAHEIVLANGAPSETFVDNVSRRAFDNYAEFEELYGVQPEMKELPQPRASNARHLPARIRDRLGIGSRRESVA